MWSPSRRRSPSVYRRNGRMFSMGNGGSSCDASHFAVEFLHPVTAGRPALTAVNLATDMAMVTAVGNDVGFGHIFLRQLIALARRGDGVIGFSTSGSSENMLAAFAKAKELGVVTIGLAGHDGGKMARSPDLDHCLVVRATAFIASRRRIWRSITSCGTLCTRCWPTTAARWRRVLP